MAIFFIIASVVSLFLVADADSRLLLVLFFGILIISLQLTKILEALNNLVMTVLYSTSKEEKDKRFLGVLRELCQKDIK